MKFTPFERRGHDQADDRQMALLLEELCRLAPVVDRSTQLHDRTDRVERPVQKNRRRPTGQRDASKLS